MSYRIFLVEDDAKIAGAIAEHLAMYGYDLHSVRDFARTEAEFLEQKPHLVLMDVNLPFQDGFHLTRTLRRHSSVPILFLSARSGDMEQVLGMESGGDDYITKPFSLEVLHAKIKAMLRRAYGDYAAAETSARAILRSGGLELDLTAQELRCGGAAQPVSRNEIKLLRLFIENV
ncbi:MAG TPA: response regulator, partial [Symbiobacteriaceae bacterium]|nr:response regulator [Symbiobacteriaceae bacterium]